MSASVRSIRDVRGMFGQPSPYVQVTFGCGHWLLACRTLLRALLFGQLHECGQCAYGREP